LLPPIDGIGHERVHTCWTLEDARQIGRVAKPGARVVLLGAGFIGCIILEALIARGVQLTIVEMAERMVSRMLDATAGDLLERWCRNKGVRVHTGTRVEAIAAGSPGDGTLRVHCLGREPLPADLVVVAAGVAPNTDFLATSGIDLGQGIHVDAQLQTNVPGVYAAGDVCEGLDWSTGGRAVHAIQPTASEHGRIAALNMTGGDVAYPGSLSMNVLDTLGLVSASFGLWMGVDGGDNATLLDADRFRYLRLQFADDRLVGAISLGHSGEIGVLRGLIQSRVRLGTWKRRLMDDPVYWSQAYVACTQYPEWARPAP
jgi:NAD(P)H-nitrite reductase large subunit